MSLAYVIVDAKPASAATATASTDCPFCAIAVNAFSAQVAVQIEPMARGSNDIADHGE